MQQISPLSGAKESADLAKTAMVNAVISLFKWGFVPGVSTTKAELEAEECDFTDYTTKTIAAWTGPVLAPVAGYQINAPVQTWTVVTATVGNTVGGYWIENAGGDVIDIVTFDDPGVPMTNVDQAVQVTPVEFFPAQSIAS